MDDVGITLDYVFFQKEIMIQTEEASACIFGTNVVPQASAVAVLLGSLGLQFVKNNSLQVYMHIPTVEGPSVSHLDKAHGRFHHGKRPLTEYNCERVEHTTQQQSQTGSHESEANDRQG